MIFSTILKEKGRAFGLEFSEAQCASFQKYYELLMEWNHKVNLTRITEPEEVAVKHIIDSLSCYRQEWFTEGASLIDVGTGAGFPGIPLKIWKPDINLTLLDSLQKRVGFLQEVSSQLRLETVKVLHGRAEELGKNPLYREKFDVATARAVARMNVLAELCLPFVKKGGCFLALKGAQAEDEAREAVKACSVLGGEAPQVYSVILPELDDKRGIIMVVKKKATPALYPRKPGTPEKKPL